MEILTSVVGKIAEYTIVPIGRQASYLIFYKGNFKTLKDHAENLEAARERMLHSVEREMGNGREIEKDVLNWLEKVNEVIEKANQLQNDPRRPNVSCSALSFPNLVLRHQLSRKATKIAKDVVKVQGKGIFDQVGHLPPLDIVASSSTIDGEMYDTRESLKEDIVKALADSTSRSIGVYGLGGVGKTTLVMKVAQTAKEHKLFDTVVMAEVSKNPDIKRIQGEIADFLSLRFDEETTLGRAHRLRQRIKMEKSILIILDNIWTILDLKTVGIPFGNEHNGCKLLMTSRDQDVLLQMDVPKDITFKVELMNENEAWILFQSMAGDAVKYSNLKDIPYQVAQKCEGLPLRVVTVARAMKNKRDVQSWKDALRKLQGNDHTEMDAITSALKLSYNSLESDEMRALFLLFALLLGNDIEYFFKVSMGLDILKHINVMDDARKRLYTIIKSLEATCLLLEVKIGGKIQMNDFVHDFAISIARGDKHVLLRKQSDEEWPTNDFLKRCTQIVLDRCRMHELPQTIYCPNIKFFFLYNVNRSLEIPDTFFEGMRSLRVLTLTYLNMLSLPTSFRLLTDLQTLCLDQCILENMGALETLQNLEILSLCKSSIIKLPRVIGRLIQLRMLDLSHSGIEVVPPNIISSLTKLEELYMGNTSISWEDVNSTVQNENASLAELRKLPNLTALELQIRETWMLPRDLQLVFEKLERYKIAIGDVWDWSDIMHKPLKTLMLKLGTNIHLEHGIKVLIKGVENLYLDDVDGIQNVLYQLNGEGFPLLKHLHVQNNAHLKQIVDSKERNQIHVSFPILETLVLLNLINLEHVCHGQPSITSFGNLSVIKVKNCVQLKYLFSYAVVKEFSHISKIEVCECNSMKEIVFGDNNSSANNDIADEKIEFLLLRSLTLEHLETLDNFASEKYQGLEPFASTPFFNAQVAFPNLDTLKLSSLLNLNKVWDENHQSMCNLTSLIVDNSGGLKYLFPSTLVESFMNLKHLEISNCSLMEEIITKDERNNALEEVAFPNLDTLKLSSLLNLNKVWDENHQSMCNLTSLIVDNCGGLKYLFPSTLVESFMNLKHLEISNCSLMEEIITKDERNNALEEVAFPNLDTLKLSSLLNLNKVWDENHQSMCNLTSLIVDNCGGVKYLFPSTLVVSFMNLKHLEISNCSLMEEIITKDERNNALEEVHFLKLEKVILKDMDNLKTIWHYQFKTLKMLQVNNCKKIVVVFPSSVQNTYNELEKLEVTNCDLVEEIFELTFNENNSVEDTSHLIDVIIVGLSNLKKIWSRDPEGILSFQAINYVIVNDCPSLEYLLPLSVATRCSHLKELGIKNCENMEEIFAEEKLGIKNCENMEEIVAEEKESHAAPIFEFNQLSTLFLWHLPKLNGFYAGSHTLLCPSLRINSVFECTKLNLFRTSGARNM